MLRVAWTTRSVTEISLLVLAIKTEHPRAVHATVSEPIACLLQFADWLGELETEFEDAGAEPKFHMSELDAPHNEHLLLAGRVTGQVAKVQTRLEGAKERQRRPSTTAPPHSIVEITSEALGALPSAQGGRQRMDTERLRVIANNDRTKECADREEWLLCNFAGWLKRVRGVQGINHLQLLFSCEVTHFS